MTTKLKDLKKDDIFLIELILFRGKVISQVGKWTLVEDLISNKRQKMKNSTSITKINEEEILLLKNRNLL